MTVVQNLTLLRFAVIVTSLGLSAARLSFISNLKAVSQSGHILWMYAVQRMVQQQRIQKGSESPLVHCIAESS